MHTLSVIALFEDATQFKAVYIEVACAGAGDQSCGSTKYNV